MAGTYHPSFDWLKALRGLGAPGSLDFDGGGAKIILVHELPSRERLVRHSSRGLVAARATMS